MGISPDIGSSNTSGSNLSYRHPAIHICDDSSLIIKGFTKRFIMINILFIQHNIPYFISKYCTFSVKWQLFFKCFFSSQLPVYAQKKPHHIRGSPFLFTHSRSLSCSVIRPFSLHSFGCSLNVIHSVNTNICIYAVGGFFCYRRQYY